MPKRKCSQAFNCPKAILPSSGADPVETTQFSQLPGSAPQGGPTTGAGPLTRPVVVALSHHPAPYRDPTFQEVHARGNMRLVVILLRRIPHNHSYWDLDDFCYPSILMEDTAGPARVASLVSQLARLSPSAIVVPGHSGALIRAALLYAMAARVPVVYSADTISEESNSSPIRRLAKRAMLGFLSLSCPAFWVPGRASRDYLISSGVAADRVFEGYYCLDQRQVRQDFEAALAERAVLRANLGFAPDEFVFLMVGEMLPFRGVSRLVKVFARLGRPSTGLLVVGGGAEAKRVREMVRGSNAHVCLAEPVAFRQLARYYAVADSYVHPGHEPYSLALMQAALCGLSIVATPNVGAASDVLVDGASGLVVPEFDEDALSAAITALASEPKRSRDMGSEAQRMASVRTTAWAATQLESAVRHALHG